MGLLLFRWVFNLICMRNSLHKVAEKYKYVYRVYETLTRARTKAILTFSLENNREF